MNLIYVFIGGGLGAACRYLVSLIIGSSDGFPLSTLTANLLGCLLIGISSAWLINMDQKFQLLLMVGFLGGFTTFSTYGIDMMHMLQAGRWGYLWAYVLLSNLGGLACVILGNRIMLQFIK